ncbi:hypothetical protein M9H77_23635 [Catharanthus roseus]|uniref:Uncharacterized protein n=1 Tax=Catharanthus roseus TaxID=4058 RepID=A0ACC0AV40_CATRO|nr:hypothetical protein M9H77_23635 [Catharanthus roseus]
MDYKKKKENAIAMKPTSSTPAAYQGGISHVVVLINYAHPAQELLISRFLAIFLPLRDYPISLQSSYTHTTTLASSTSFEAKVDGAYDQSMPITIGGLSICRKGKPSHFKVSVNVLSYRPKLSSASALRLSPIPIIGPSLTSWETSFKVPSYQIAVLAYLIVEERYRANEL